MTRMSRGQVRIATETLRVALEHAALLTEEPLASTLRRAAVPLESDAIEPDPRLPRVGSTVERPLRVGHDDLASAMGHPDPAMAVLGSPRIALWFELVSSDVFPIPSGTSTHVGVGILVHHLSTASIGDDVAVRATVASSSGRHIIFACEARVDDRLIATGTHHRVVVDRG